MFLRNSVWTAVLLGTACGLQQPPPLDSSSSTTSRRNLLNTLVSGAVALPLTSLNAPSAKASVESTTNTGRAQLLDAISRKASDEEMFSIIEGLQDPSGGKGAALSNWLEGEWELIWSYKAEAFSPLLKLPKPLRPESFQYFGSTAASEVGDGRIAQGLTGGVLGQSQLWLSSGSTPLSEDPSILEIQPPFRFELGGRIGTGKPKKTLVDAGSDADFRDINARDKQAQAAPKNQYKQIFLEDKGPGSLRVSSVISGDPVIVGIVFVHRKV
ncbi:expressed unknown protein [Seminavis robusta]|uniref:Plastid lipid-associated protein/fibrillin conserved domain-containing protein n=1 Tax=Seminavis robusta TaxID=568900 RepID=A0A9N8H6R2_9STRA|nr:expressed unknown protein [Seminavis robusta]|eukprot:Sro178_g078270.1 n/a (270) ;mRNA; f:82856-83665